MDMVFAVLYDFYMALQIPDSLKLANRAAIQQSRFRPAHAKAQITQPKEDRWSPLELSEQFLNRIKKVSIETVILKNGGHYPVEQPALTQMRDAVVSFIERIIV